MILHPLFILAVPMVSGSNVPDGRPVLNSFVDHRISSVRDLVDQVRTDGVVADRYERHFSMSRPELLRYLSGLHRAPLVRSESFTIYSVPMDGHVKMHRGLIRKGEPMFMNARNQPILVVKCGNPVVLGPKRPGEKGKSALDLKEPETERALELAESIPSDALGLVPTLGEETLTSTALIAAPESALTSIGALATAGHGLPILSSIAALLPIVGATHHSPSFSPPIAINPVPEPATMVAIAAGAMSLLRRRKRG